MTREETASFIRAYLDGDTAIGNIIPIRDVLESAITYLTEQPTLPAGMEEAAMRDSLDYVDSIPDGGTDKHPWNDHDVEKAYYDGMLAGAEWQREQDQQLIELAEDHAMLAGMNKMKEEMMERAVETEVVSRIVGRGLLPAVTFLVDDSYKEGDKVKVIVIPEENLNAIQNEN